MALSVQGIADSRNHPAQLRGGQASPSAGWPLDPRRLSYGLCHYCDPSLVAICAAGYDWSSVLAGRAPRNGGSCNAP